MYLLLNVVRIIAVLIRSIGDKFTVEYTELKHSIQIYIPGESQGETLDYKLVNSVIEEICSTLACCTAYDAIGYYLGTIELVKVVESYSETPRNEDWLKLTASYIKSELRQESVAIKVNGALRIYK